MTELKGVKGSSCEWEMEKQMRGVRGFERLKEWGSLRKI